MHRREIIRLLAASATGVWSRPRLEANGLLRAARAVGAAGMTSQSSAPHPPQENAAPGPLLALFPLPLVLFPGANIPLHIFEERYKEMIQDCLRDHLEFGILRVSRDSFDHIGCSASISQVARRYADGQMDIAVRGRRRFEVSLLNREKSYLRGVPQFLEDDATDAPTDELRQQAIQLNLRLLKLLDLEEPSPNQVETVDAPLSFQIMADLPAEPAWEQSLLELRSERERLVRVVRYLQQLIGLVQRSPAHRPPPGAL